MTPYQANHQAKRLEIVLAAKWDYLLPKEGSLPGHTPPRLLPLSCQPRGCGGGIGRSPPSTPEGRHPLHPSEKD